MSDSHSTNDAATPSLWAETFVNVLVHPARTFELMAEEPAFAKLQTSGAIFAVILVSLIDGLLGAGTTSPGLLLFAAFFALFFGFLRWACLVTSLFLASIALGSQKSRFLSCFVTTGWAFVPLIFVAPLSCYHNLLGHSYIFCYALIFLWVVVLECLAIQKTFRISSLETFCLVVAVPQLVLLTLFLFSSAIIAEALNCLS